jgi:hypothetical protein
MIKMKDQCGFTFQPGETLRVHPLPNPSPVKGEGLFGVVLRRLKVNGTAVGQTTVLGE